MRHPGFLPSVALGPTRDPLFELEIHVVTPLFGGSAQAGQVDHQLPIRGASVRGHLRFWWRACKGAGYDNPRDLFEAEKRIWGSTDEPGAIDVDVEMLQQGKEVSSAEYSRRPDGTYGSLPKWREGYPAYALFPFQGKLKNGRTQIDQPPAKALEDVGFRLRLLSARRQDRDSLCAEAEAALWAWLTFGGIGARTRRGCGSLFCSHGAFHPSGDIRKWLKQKADTHVTSNHGDTLIPLLSGARLLWGNECPVLDAWCKAIEAMHSFRQGLNFARKHGSQPNRPGRSRWPEADSIRKAINAWDPRHFPQHPACPFYPRADLGLPIVFHFSSDKDPSDCILEASGDKATRMASPIILKPLALSKD
ncbi:MAG: type III-B CRISPR module RAMP protein Cmr1, partial [Armatimonadota bacterium]